MPGETIRPFTTDGCSGGLSWLWRKLKGTAPPWEGVCIEHDREYWAGGSKKWRRTVDAIFFHRMVKCAPIPFVVAMWIAVRIGGHPLLPFSWRWGYGYRWPRGYTRRD